MTNCPNCGAVRSGDICEYCGTVFDYIHDPAQRIAQLKRENDRIQEITNIKFLYESALAAMRGYAK